MTQLKAIKNQQFLQELKERINRQEISKEELFDFLEKPNQAEVITEYQATDLSKLTKKDWAEACQILQKSKTYQKEIKLWDSIDDE